MNEMCLWGKYRKYYMSLFFQIILNSRCYTLRRHKRDVFDASSYNARNNNFGNPVLCTEADDESYISTPLGNP